MVDKTLDIWTKNKRKQEVKAKSYLFQMNFLTQVMFIFWSNRKVKLFDIFYLTKSNILISIDIIKLNILIINSFQLYWLISIGYFQFNRKNHIF